MAMSPMRGRGFYDLHSEMNRMFDDVFGGLARRTGRQQGAQASEWAPSMDVLNRDGDLVVRAELPGVRQEDVDITVHDRVLTISGERREEQQQERGGYYVKERRLGNGPRALRITSRLRRQSRIARLWRFSFRAFVLRSGVVGSAGGPDILDQSARRFSSFSVFAGALPLSMLAARRISKKTSARTASRMFSSLT